jgi:hypothetical protein
LNERIFEMECRKKNDDLRVENERELSIWNEKNKRLINM